MRRSALEADDPRVPDWPVAHSCRLCGLEVWRVCAPNGFVVEIDANPLEAEWVTSDEGLRRLRVCGAYKFSVARGVGGWRLEDPVLVRGGVDVGWHWYCSRVPLEAVNPELTFSEHIFTCPEQDLRHVAAAISRCWATGDAAGDPQAKARGAAERVKKFQEREALRLWAESASRIPLPSELGISVFAARQEPLF